MEGENRTGQYSENDQNNDPPDVGHDNGRNSDEPSQSTRELNGTPRVIDTFPR